MREASGAEVDVLTIVSILRDAQAALGDAYPDRVIRSACGVLGAAGGLDGLAELARAAASGLDDLAALGSPAQVAAGLGAAHEAMLADRHRRGAYYTPDVLVEQVLTAGLDPVTSGRPGEVVRVLDPACGTGNVLVAAVSRGSASGAHVEAWGSDLDASAVEIARLRLRLADPALTAAEAEHRVVVADGLRARWDEPFDAVLGNPPFLNQLRTETALRPAQVAVLEGGPDSSGAYTDLSARFLRRMLDLVRPGGRVALVQPLSLLAARDAAPVRAAVADAGALRSLWWSEDAHFAGAAVRTCVPAVEVGGHQSDVAVSTESGTRQVPTDSLAITGQWGFLVGGQLGIPQVSLARTAGVLGDLADCTADFRDQYYGLVPAVREADSARDRAGASARLITSGLIDPAESRWGLTPARFAKRAYAAPVVDLDGLTEPLQRWARARLVPKVLLATQTPLLEAVVDRDGEWLPSVPVITVVPPVDRLWHVLAVLLSPPLLATAATSYAGAARSVRALKLSARQVADLPLPTDPVAWERGARCARRAQEAVDPQERLAELGELARQMCAAYGLDDGECERVSSWWLGRLTTLAQRRAREAATTLRGTATSGGK